MIVCFLLSNKRMPFATSLSRHFDGNGVTHFVQTLYPTPELIRSNKIRISSGKEVFPYRIPMTAFKTTSSEEVIHITDAEPVAFKDLWQPGEFLGHRALIMDTEIPLAITHPKSNLGLTLWRGDDTDEDDMLEQLADLNSLENFQEFGNALWTSSHLRYKDFLYLGYLKRAISSGKDPRKSSGIAAGLYNTYIERVLATKEIMK